MHDVLLWGENEIDGHEWSGASGGNGFRRCQRLLLNTLASCTFPLLA